MKKVILIVMTLVLSGICGASLATAKEYNYITAEDLNARLEADSSMILIDICTADQFAKGHIKGAIETNAYPVKTDEEKARLAEHLPTVKASADDIIVICPRGGGGAKNTVDFYRAKGIEADRLLILEKGMDKWPFASEAK